MKTVVNRLSLGLIGSLVALGLLLGGGSAQAASSYKDKEPTLNSIKKVEKTGAKLIFKFKALKDKKVIADVRIRNTETGQIMHEKFNVRINKEGKKTVMVKGLDPGTKYEFKVRVRKSTLNYYSDYSNRRTATTSK